MQLCFDLNEPKQASFLVVLNEVMLKWASEENTLHLSVVAQSSSSQRLSSSTSLSIHHPSFRLMRTHSHAIAENAHALSKASLEPKWSAITAYFTHPLRFTSGKSTRMCFYTWTCKHSKGHRVVVILDEWFVNAVRLNTGKSRYWTQSCESVNECVCLFFFFFFSYGCVLSLGLFIFHTKAYAHSYLLRAKQIDMTIHVSFICRLNPCTHTHTQTRWEALVLADSSGMGNAPWTFVICVSGCRLPGCFSAAFDKSERLPVRNIIPAFH